MKFRFRLTLNLILLIGLTILAAGLFIAAMWEKSHMDALKENIAREARIIRTAVAWQEQVEPGDEAVRYTRLARELRESAGARVTFIDADGTVLGDSDHDPAAMENHADREEIVQAAAEGIGFATRYSRTLRQNMLYVSVPALKDGQIAGYYRLSMSLQEVDRAIRRLWMVLFVGLAVLLAVGGLLSYRIAYSMTKPLDEIRRVAGEISRSNYRSRVHLRRRDEIGELADAINKMVDNMEQQLDSIRRLERMRSEFVANVSHELKTPIAAIKGFAETLRTGAMDDRQSADAFLQIILDESERLNRLIGDILELSNIESKQVQLSSSPIELRGFIDRTLGLMRNEARRKRIGLSMKVVGELYIEADEERLRQILINLLSNAINYTPEDGRVTVTAELAGDDKIRMTVADTGIGIPEEDLPRIFERFYRVDKARSRSSGGTGLGLSIVKHLVELHRGTVAVESRLGTGTAFVIELPVIQG